MAEGGNVLSRGGWTCARATAVRAGLGFGPDPRGGSRPGQPIGDFEEAAGENNPPMARLAGDGRARRRTGGGGRDLSRVSTFVLKTHAAKANAGRHGSRAFPHHGRGARR